MQRKQNKEKALFAYADKILSVEQIPLTEPFPKNIHQLLVAYIQFSYYICVFPYRLKYNRSTSQYETSSSTVHRVLFAILWLLSLLNFAEILVKHIISIKPRDPISVLLVLGGLGHIFHLSTYIITTIYYRNEIITLINYFLLYGALSSEKHSSASPNFPCGTHSTFKTRKVYPILSNQTESRKEGSMHFKRIAEMWWAMTLVVGIKCSGIIDKILAGTSRIDLENSQFYRFLAEILPFKIEEISKSSSLSSHFLHVFLSIVHFSANMEKFSVIFVIGLEVMIALCMKFIASHFIFTLKASRDYWKPSSRNVLANFVIIRKSYRMINRIFGWMFLYTIMGEFPNFTFFVVFLYSRTNENIQWVYAFGFLYMLLLLTIASVMVNELSKFKDWMHYEDKRHWSLSNGYSLRRRIILFELSLNRNALYAHGVFQLSLPASVSIVAGILSNALIILQLAMSNAG